MVSLLGLEEAPAAPGDGKTDCGAVLSQDNLPSLLFSKDYAKNETFLPSKESMCEIKSYNGRAWNHSAKKPVSDLARAVLKQELSSL